MAGKPLEAAIVRDEDSPVLCRVLKVNRVGRGFRMSIHGPQHIPDYLLFNRLVYDTGFAGRWVLTVYVFISAGFAVSIYQLARKLLTKLNKGKIGETS